MKVRAACETFSLRTFLILRYLSPKSSLSERGLCRFAPKEVLNFRRKFNMIILLTTKLTIFVVK